MAKFETKKTGITVSQNGKSFSISGSAKSGELALTNEYGNSISFPLDDQGFDQLWSAIWEFVKDRQH